MPNKIIVYAFVSRGFSTLFAFLFSITVARLLSKEDVGAYFTGFTIMVGLAIVTKMGFDNYIIRHNSGEVRDKISSLLSSAVSSLCVYVFLMLILVLIILLNKSVYEYVYTREYLIYFIISSFFFSLLHLSAGFLKSINRAPSANFIELGLMPLVLIAVYTVYAKKISLLNAAEIYFIVSFVLSVSLYVYLMVKYKSNKNVELNFSLSNIKESSNIMLAGLIDYLVMWFSALVLIWYVSMSDIAQFHVAVRLTALISFILIVVNSVNAPIFARLFKNNQLAQVSEVLRISTSLTTLFALALALFLIFFSDFLLGLFGDEYQTAGAEFYILVFGQLINVVSGSVGYVLMMSGNSHVYKINAMFGALASVVLALIFVPDLGVVGAAIATSAGISIKNLLGVYHVYQIYGIVSFPSMKNILQILTLKESYEVFTDRN